MARLDKYKLLLLAETTKFKSKMLWYGVRVSILLVAFLLSSPHPTPQLAITTCTPGPPYVWYFFYRGKWRLTCCASQNFLEFSILLSLLLAHSTTHSILLVLCKAPQQNFLVHVKGSLYSRMSFQEERRHNTPTIGVRSLPLLRCRPTSSPFNTLWSTYV